LHLITLDTHTHTHTNTTVSRSPPDEDSVRRSDRYLTTHNTHKGRTSMSPAGFDPAIPACKRPQTHALDGASVINY